MNSNHHLATLGGGCFWCLEAVYQEVEGVSRVVSGYAGGHLPNPTYQQVCLEVTGHAEVVQLTFDPNVVPYDRLLDIFFTIHDPTTLNRQGADHGTQYRSAIFFHDQEQERIAINRIAELNRSGLWNQPIVTTVSPLTDFYPAEDYHQNYFRNNPFQPYCLMVVRPKVTKYRDKFIR
ncbi:MAG: peptide-methionine (S)-S-oxide reductase [Acidobacteria bacterium]|nr:peptide-methionine (S)-S-oxide reductase [Acidobacteriota bacterium]